MTHNEFTMIQNSSPNLSPIRSLKISPSRVSPVCLSPAARPSTRLSPTNLSPSNVPNSRRRRRSSPIMLEFYSNQI